MAQLKNDQDPSNLIYIGFWSNNMNTNKNKTNLSILKERTVISYPEGYRF